MGDKFFDADHAHMKLSGTVCLYKSIPYYVCMDGRGETVYLQPFDGGEDLVVKYTDPDFDYGHISLGYITNGGRAYYLAREPRRINQQGLTASAVVVTPRESGVSGESLVFSKAFIDCVLGQHKTYGEAIELLRGSHTGCSISRHMAVHRDSRRIFKILYRGDIVALSQDAAKSFKPIEHEGVHIIIKRLREHGIPLALSGSVY